MKKITQITAKEAANLVKNGDTILVGGFGLTGHPVSLMRALAETSTQELSYVGNNVGEAGGLGGGQLLLNGQLKKMTGSYFTSNPQAVEYAMSGKIEYELLPQGTLAEAIRAGGAGIGGFYTPTSAGTPLAEGRETKTIQGEEQVFIPGIRGNVAFIRAEKADEAGNLVYSRTDQNFNRAMAMAADVVVAEVGEVVPTGQLAPDAIHTPAVFVDYLVTYPLVKEDLGSSTAKDPNKKTDPLKALMAKRAYQELQKGDVVNLGIGIPTLVADLINPEDEIMLHTENGLLGVGPEPTDGDGAMDYPVNAGKIPVTALKGASYFDSADSFAMIRGKHVDVAIMGGLEVDQHGNLANWTVPGRPLLGVGGAMDLAKGAQRLVITMSHCNRKGESKVLPQCQLPLTASNVVDVLITDLAVFTFENGTMYLTELMPDVTLETVKAQTLAEFEVRL